MKKQVVLLTALTILGGLGTCEAKMLPSGTSGVINVPNAHVRSMGHVSVGAQATEDAYIFGANIALIPGLEVAASHWNPEVGDSFNTFSGKFEFLPETAVSPALALGVEDIGDKLERSGYAVASKSLPWGLEAHAGIGTDRFKNGFVALEKSIGKFNLAIEYDGYDFNYGASMPLAKFLQAEAGVRSKTAFAGVNFTF